MKDLVRMENERRGRPRSNVPFSEYRAALRQIEKLHEQIAALEKENTLLSLIGPAANERMKIQRFRK